MGIQEQQEELEALSFIFPDEFELLSENSCQIKIFWDFNPEIPNSQDLELLAKFEFPPEYPDSPLVFHLENPKEITSQDLIILKENLDLKIQEFLGLAMVFNIIEYIKQDLIQIIKNRIFKEIQQETLEIIQEKRIGTRVTAESFQKWKSEFKNEIFQLLAKGLPLSVPQNDFSIIHGLQEAEKKVSGRQLFEKDVTLATVDLKLVDDLEGVSVDLSLFKDLDLDSQDLDSQDVLVLDLSED